MKISACMITKNEEDCIRRSIESYRDIVEEIIVVDSESTDDTVKIAKSLGAKVYTRPWTDDFAAAKNYAIDRAKGDWIIFLDADEYFDAGGAARAREFMRIAAGDRAIDALSVQMKHFADEERNVLTIHPIVRIFKNFRKIRYKSKVHEYLQKEGEKLQALIIDEVILLHTGYIQKIMPEKLERNLKLLMELEALPHMRCDIALSKAECYNGLKRYEDVLAAIEEVMASENLDSFLRKSPKAPDVYKFKTGAMLGLRDRFADQEIEACIGEGMRKFPAHPEITQLMVQYLYESERQAEAIPYMEKALKQDEAYKDHYMNSFSGARDKKYVALGDLYSFYQNDPVSARRCYEKALEVSKYNMSALSGYLWSIPGSDITFVMESLNRFYNKDNSEDMRMVITAGLFCGMQDVFTTYFMYFAGRWPEKVGADQKLINKVNLMKRDYQSLIGALAPFWLIGEWAVHGQAEKCARWTELGQERQKELILEAIAELVQSRDENVLKKLLAGEELCREKSFAKKIAKAFEMLRQFGRAGEYYGYAGMHTEAKRMEFLLGDGHRSG